MIAARLRHIAARLRRRAPGWRTLLLAAVVLVLTPLTLGPQVSTAASGPPGDLDGWRQTVVEDFDTPVALGGYTSSRYADDFFPYDGSRDTFKTGQYQPDEVLSVNDGKLDWFLHADGDTRNVGAVVVTTPSTGWGQTYGRFSVRYRSEVVPGYKMAFLLWPDSDNWAEGEVDFPESHSLEADQPIFANLFRPGNLSSGKPGASTVSTSKVASAGSGWHVATIEWQPDRLTFILDGAVVGTRTVGVPDTAMHWVLQVESSHDAGRASLKESGHLQVDWVTAYSRS